MQKIIVRRVISPELTLEKHPVLTRIYAGRGIKLAAELDYGLNYLLPYGDLKGIEQAVACLELALRQQQHILILGDFDADGATSAAVAVSGLQRLGAKNVSFLVPNRFEYGYGLTPEIVDVAAKRQPQLIVTVDNGISSVEGVARAKELGIKVLITDHHLPGAVLPAADAIVNPNQAGDIFPSKNLAGVGVIFYVLLALRAHLRQMGWFVAENLPEPMLSELLDLVALGTVADVVPLDRINRILVHHGLKRIRAGKACPGIQALLTVANRSHPELIASDLGYAIAPRLNAAGRLEDMSLGIKCLLATDLHTAQQLAQQLDQLNNERREIESTMQQQAIEALKKLQLTQHLPPGVCMHDASWHQGVIGIVASRIKDRLHRPVIAFATINAREIKGSARSISGIHIRDILDAIAKRHPTLIHKFGGHAMAAGLSLAIEDYQAFSAAFAAEVGLHLSPDTLQGKVITDGELDADHFSLPMAELLREAGPWGQNFPEPLFDNEFVLLQQHLVGGKHLKLMLSLPATKQPVFTAIAFNIDREKWPNYRAEKIHAAYRLAINEFRGQRTLQLIIEHLEV